MKKLTLDDKLFDDVGVALLDAWTHYIADENYYRGLGLIGWANYQKEQADKLHKVYKAYLASAEY